MRARSGSAFRACSFVARGRIIKINSRVHTRLILTTTITIATHACSQQQLVEGPLPIVEGLPEHQGAHVHILALLDVDDAELLAGIQKLRNESSHCHSNAVESASVLVVSAGADDATSGYTLFGEYSLESFSRPRSIDLTSGYIAPSIARTPCLTFTGFKFDCLGGGLHGGTRNQNATKR